jgi:hypothetical protein
MSATAVCTYRVKKGREDEFLGLLRRHWPTLREVGLAEDTPSTVYKGTGDWGGTFFVEILTWKDSEMPNRAHELPAVMAIWEPMGMCCESMEFPYVEELPLHKR